MRTFRGYFSQRKQAAVNVIRAESMGLETAASVMAEAPRDPNATLVRSIMEQTQKLVPGEAMAGYLGLSATFPAMIVGETRQLALGVLAMAFLLVTMALRYWGTRVTDVDGRSRSEWHAVLISGLAFVAFVYASGQQMWVHAPMFGLPVDIGDTSGLTEDQIAEQASKAAGEAQKWAGQVVTSILGILAPLILGILGARPATPDRPV